MPNETIADLTEAQLIHCITARLPPPPDWLAVGIGDDAAVVEPARNRLEVLSVDALVDGVHFDRAFTPPAAIGHRALAVNLSDLAAMGATPRLALMSLALPASLPVAEFEAIVTSFVALAGEHRMTIAGGNLTRTPGPLVVDVTVLGTAKRRQVLTRTGAKPGDELYVTGSIGGAAAGLQMLKLRHKHSTTGDTEDTEEPHRVKPDRTSASTVASVAETCIEQYLYPKPRLRIGSLLGRNRAATACMDLSDGLAEAVHQIAAINGIGVTVDADALPLSPDARHWFEGCGMDPTHEALTGGDDYELAFAVSPRARGRLRAAERHGDVSLTRIGACTAERVVMLRQRGADQPLPRGYRHFR
jgi:thiamine-monophosphate kinase